MFQTSVFFFICATLGINGALQDKSISESTTVLNTKSNMSPVFNEDKEELLAVARVRERAKEQQVYRDIGEALKIAEDGFLAEERAIAMRLRSERREIAFKEAIKKAFTKRSAPTNSSRALYGGSYVQLSEREINFREAVSKAFKKD